jgi:hypothetical protein
MGSGIHGFPKVSLRPTMPDPSKPCGWANPKMALQPFLGWSSRRADSLRPSSTPLDTPRRTGLLGEGGMRNAQWSKCVRNGEKTRRVFQGLTKLAPTITLAAGRSQGVITRPVRHGISKRVEDRCRPPAMWAGHPQNGCMLPPLWAGHPQKGR